MTGANSGIGYQTALGLACKGVEVILACRNTEKAEEAKRTITREYPRARVTSMKVDVSRLRAVRKFADQFEEQYDRLDLLINNAGMMMPPYRVTEEGLESQLATNYLGHFALTGRLLSLLTTTAGSRVVSVSSLSYRWAKIQFDDLHFERGYSKSKAYGQSKRACLMFAYELQRRLSAGGYPVASVAAHPGLSNTNLDQYFPSLIRPLGALFLQRAEQGALPVLYAALAETLQGGEFIGPDGFQQMRGYPTKVDSDDYAKSSALAWRLWQISEEMTHTHYLSEH